MVMHANGSLMMMRFMLLIMIITVSDRGEGSGPH